MKIIRKTILTLLLFIVLLGAGIYVYLQWLKPQYSGNISLKGLSDEVEILFDEYGIPHIYAQNEEDVYLALGYVHAQERLFQMEMMRRVGGGCLAEILGEDMVKTDRFFRTLGIERVAEQSVAKYMNGNTQPYQKAALAYLKGINQYIEKGKTPIEFTILNIPKEEFTPKDIYLIMGYMAFNFAHGFRTDPIVTQVQQQYGSEYLKDLAVHWVPGDEKIPLYKSGTKSKLSESSGQNFRKVPGIEKIAIAVSKIIDNLPVAVWLGSNGWVVGPKKTASGKVIFANDTHIGYSQPSVWYEAHLECPGFSFYGNHLAGFPFGLVGHNRFSAWGLTMFENDDVDFYWEKANPENPNQLWVNDHWEDMQTIEEIIKVKGGEDVTFRVQISRHGPIINQAMETVAQLDTVPVSVWWAYAKFPSRTMQASYLLSHAKSMDDFRSAAFMIDAPGLNVMYGDRDGNIAWWATGKLVIRPSHVNSKIFMDGASGKDEPLGYYDFSENPQSENPPSGFVYSANNQPDSIAGVLYPGYYTPDHRAKRIVKYLQSGTKWTIEEMKKMNTDVTIADYPLIIKEIINAIDKDDVINTSSNHLKAVQILEGWNGDHQVGDVAPTIYYKLLYNILEMTLSDELGDESFQAFLTTHLMKRTVPVLMKNDSSIWWDNIQTPDVQETRKIIFTGAFDRAIRDLETQLGTVLSEWTWGRVHTLEHLHPIGSKKPFDRVFNVGPFAVKGGNEVINNSGFTMNKEGQYKVSFGSAMRILLDFADLENSVSINPTGQSGYFLSKHYDDQAEMYNNGIFRKQMMNREEIEARQKGKLILQPE